MKSDAYSYQKISSGPTDSDYKIRDGSRFTEWGLAGEGIWGMEMAQLPVGFLPRYVSSNTVI